MNPRRLAVLALFCSLLAASSTSANPILRGRIVDANGAPVAGAVLEIKGTKLRATSDEDGAYQVELPPGSYTLVVKRIGYAAEERTIGVPGPETEGEGLNLTLAPAPVPMRPVEIAGTWSLLHARGFALPVADLSGDRLRNGATVSLARAIEGLAGVHDLHTGEQIGKPVIRGMTGPRVLVLDDGLRLEDYSWSEEDGPSIDARLAERVEVVRGPASVLFGSDALGGVVNAIPRSIFADAPEQAESHFGQEAYLSSNNTEFGGAFLAERRDTGFGWRVFGLGRKGDDFKTPSGKLENTGFGAGNGEAMIGTRGAAGSWTARYARYSGEFKLLEAGESAAGAGEGGGPERKAADDRVQLSTTRQLGGVRFEGRGQWQRHSLIELADEADSTGAPVPGSESVQFDLLLNTVSLELLAHHGSGRFSGTFGFSGQLQKNDTRGPIPMVPDADVRSGGVFAIERLDFGRLSLLAGGRGDVREVKADSNAGLALAAETRDFRQLTGSVGAVYSLREGRKLRFNVGRAWRAPTLFELYTNGPHLAESRYEIGRRTLAPESGVEADAGLVLERARVRAEINGFYSRIRDFIYLAPTGAFVGTLRVYQHEQARATLAGGEVSADLKPGGSFTIHSRLDYTRGQNETLHEPLPLIPPLRGALGLVRGFQGGSLGASSAGLELEFAAKQTRLSAFDVPTAGYVLLNAEGGIQPTLGGQRLRVDVRVRNVADRSYRDYLSRYKEFALDPGRNVTVRISRGI